MAKKPKTLTEASIKKLILKLISDYEVDVSEEIDNCPKRCTQLETTVASLANRIAALESLPHAQPTPTSPPLQQCPFCKTYVKAKRLASHKHICPKRPGTPISPSKVQAWLHERRRIKEIGPPVSASIPTKKAVKDLTSTAPKGRLPGSFQSNC